MVFAGLGRVDTVALLLSVRFTLCMGRLFLELLQYVVLFCRVQRLSLLGHYLRNHDWSLNKILLVGIPMFLIGYVVTFFGFRYVTALPEYSEELLELFFTYCSLNVVMMTVPVFLLMKKVDVRSEKIKSLLANLTTCGFGIYMVHYFFTGPGVVLMRALHVPVALQIPAAAVVAFAISWLIVASIYRLMGKNARYVVG